VWYSSESFANFIIDNTNLSGEEIIKSRLYESDANNPSNFHTMPDHIRKILYLDSPDLIVEREREPIFSVEVSTEAGTGHNVFQRFARIAASVENSVPSFYIYPEAVMVSRRDVGVGWDRLNPLIFQALESIISIYDIPAFLYYFPSYFREYENADEAPNGNNKGLKYDSNIVEYPGCPDGTDPEIQSMFGAINEVIDATSRYGVVEGRARLTRSLVMRERRTLMQNEFYNKIENREPTSMSPLSATKTIPTSYLLDYLSEYESAQYRIGELLRSRQNTILYQVNARFRGDPYPGALAAIDYLLCREGKTYEDRRHNLILIFGDLIVDNENEEMRVNGNDKSSILDFFRDVQNSERHNLLTRDYEDLESNLIPRYYMQVRYGSTYSKVKHIRIYSYFADAILFPDGALWRDG
jgi:hypothetical protein